MKYSPAIFAQVHGLPVPVAEHRFHATRKWRFDFAWPAARVALEVEGGVWTGGRHTRGAGYAGDVEKYNEATLAGWRVLRCQPREVFHAKTGAMIRQAINATPPTAAWQTFP